MDEFSAFAWFVPMQEHQIKLKAELTSAEVTSWNCIIHLSTIVGLTKPHKSHTSAKKVATRPFQGFMNSCQSECYRFGVIIQQVNVETICFQHQAKVLCHTSVQSPESTAA
jgi:hypothetical protein